MRLYRAGIDSGSSLCGRVRLILKTMWKTAFGSRGASKLGSISVSSIPIYILLGLLLWPPEALAEPIVIMCETEGASK